VLRTCTVNKTKRFLKLAVVEARTT